MTLRTAVAAPFQQNGTRRMGESELVVAMSLDRDWFSPDQAKRLVDVAAGEGLLDREDGDVVARFDPTDVEVPDGFVPDEGVLQERTTFERVLDACVDAGVEKRSAVAAINTLQSELGVTVEAAALVYANGEGVDVTDLAERARGDL